MLLWLWQHFKETWCVHWYERQRSPDGHDAMVCRHCGKTVTIDRRKDI